MGFDIVVSVLVFLDMLSLVFDIEAIIGNTIAAAIVSIVGTVAIILVLFAAVVEAALASSFILLRTGNSYSFLQHTSDILVFYPQLQYIFPIYWGRSMKSGTFLHIIYFEQKDLQYGFKLKLLISFNTKKGVAALQYNTG